MLYDLATVIRSRNAGPFTLTIDLMVETANDFQRMLQSPAFSPVPIARLYDVGPEAVAIHPFERVLAIKVLLPRQVSSGAPGDADVYGSQQHMALGETEIA